MARSKSATTSAKNKAASSRSTSKATHDKAKAAPTRVTRRGKVKPARKRGWNYPRQGYGPIHRWLPSWRVVLGTFLGSIALLVGTFVALYITIDVPEPDDFALAETTKVYYSDGSTEMGSFADYDRESVALSDLPDVVPHAVIASEDRSFYSNNGIDIKGILRALINNVSGGAQQGGSTLTQQYVERYYLGTTTGYAGKIKEAILALKIDREQSKDEILENYLNTIYFGRGAYGIEVAAQKYFGIHASELNLSQAALLAGIIPAPSSGDPAVNPEYAQQRWQRVLNLMVQDGYCTQEEADAAEFPETIEPVASNDYAGPNGYLLSTVTSELVASGEFTEDELSTMGLQIVTTIDQEKQEAAVAAVDNLPEDRPENNYVGLVSVDPRNGEIYAMYGGADYLVRQRNAVTQDVAQGGSTFKPFALLAALDQDMSVNTRYDSSSPKVIDGLEIENFDSSSRGNINLVTATMYSVNTVYVQLNKDVGPENTRAVAVQAGIPEDTAGLDDTLTNVLGSASPHPIDTAKAYATFAAGGVQHDPHIVREVRDRDGNVIYSADTEGTRVFEENTIAQLNYVLQQVTTPGATGATAGQLGRPVAGKTGTSTGPVSAWFCGYIPQMVTVVNMYQIGEDGSEEVLTGFGDYTNIGIGGGSFPAQIWLDYMQVATADMEVEDFPDPVWTGSVPAVDSPTTSAPTVTDEPTETEEPTQEPTETEEPTQEPTEEPQPIETEEPTPTPNQPTGGDPGGGDGEPSPGSGP
ncbi:MAG: penicillin-binding protein [Actinomycetaceae bacterium]|nr:penicillin-binding protein [Actinomycetaceae bacterium]